MEMESVQFVVKRPQMHSANERSPRKRSLDYTAAENVLYFPGQRVEVPFLFFSFVLLSL